ncbi:MAG: hypothetical protein M3Q58_11600 [Bacteroidota bacterium]|nr:hypothetical protein [Bacteroidota bacterium]
MLDKFIKEKAEIISYTQPELSNISTSLSYLKNIINYEPEFRTPFLGGSYKRATMVKGISDVDVYFQYTGKGNSQAALTKLKNSLISSYPNSIIKQDKPSILADFSKIPINITPYKQDMFGNMSIPDKHLLNWQIISFGELENAIISLRQKNPNLINLIKILKLWNRNHNKGIKNFEIEKRVCNLFLYNYLSSQGISDWLWTFFSNNGYKNDASKVFALMKNDYSDSVLKTEWLKYIDNR